MVSLKHKTKTLMIFELKEKELDRTDRTGNRKSGNKRPRPILIKFASHSARGKVFVNKERLKITGISITESLIKHRMEFLKKAKNEFGFNNDWTVYGRMCYYDDLAK